MQQRIANNQNGHQPHSILPATSNNGGIVASCPSKFLSIIDAEFMDRLHEAECAGRELFWLIRSKENE